MTNRLGMRELRRKPTIISMELLLVFLSTAIGTVAGVSIATLMMRRKGQLAEIGADSVLRTRLQNAEWALASAARAELAGAQERILAAAVDVEKEAARRAQAVELVGEMAARLEAVEKRARELEAAVPAAEVVQQMETGRQRIAELEAEMASLRQNCSNAEAETTAARQKAGEISANAEAVGTEFQAQLSAEREKLEILSAELAAVRQAKIAAETLLLEERQSTAEGMRLLLQAQNKLSEVASREPSVGGVSGGNGVARVTAVQSCAESAPPVS